MADLLSLIPQLLQGGLGNLAAYLAAHVLLCLVPAFFIAAAAGSPPIVLLVERPV